MSLGRLSSIVLRVAALSLIIVVSTGLLATWVWHTRPSLEDTELPPWPLRERQADRVTVTWLGVSTLLFDDGETQILIDGYLSRPSLADLLLGRPIESNAVEVNRVLNDYRINRLAVIVPTHTHFDHALDIAAIANRTGATIFGSPSSAQIARGAGVPEEDISIVTDSATREFGQFRITLLMSEHIPFGWRGSVPMAGEIESPIVGAAPAAAFKSGRTFSVVVAHPQGTTLVQASAGFAERRLQDVDADVVMLSTAMLEGLGRDYTQRYWLSLVTATGADTVIPIHFDDLTKPLGEVELLPGLIDNFATTSDWLRQFRYFWDSSADIYLPVHGEAFVLYEAETPGA